MTGHQTIGDGGDFVKRRVCCVPCLRRALLSFRVSLLCRNVDPVLPRPFNFSREAENPYFNIKCTIFKHTCG